MAQIHPFRAWRYTAAAGPLEDLVTQPYDKITPEMQARYLAKNPRNLVRVILGPKSESDTESENVYTRAAAHFDEWRSGGVIKQDAEPGFYAYFQDFTDPDSGAAVTRKGFIGTGQVEPYEADVVFRHEHTLPGPKKDRLQVLSHTRAHFGQIFMLYPDSGGEIDAVLDVAAAGAPESVVVDEYGVTHRLWPITDPFSISRIQELMAPKYLIIADGHHRYETALTFRQAHPEIAGAKNVMMTFVNMYSPGLRILGTHRVVKDLPNFDSEALIESLERTFAVKRFETPTQLSNAWAGPHPESIQIGMVLAGDDRYYLLELPRRPEDLDVQVLHRAILGELLGIGAEAVKSEFLKYVRGVENAIHDVRHGGYQAAFLLEPVSVEQMAAISVSGGVMPQKSTDFYPKLLTGIAIYRLEK